MKSLQAFLLSLIAMGLVGTSFDLHAKLSPTDQEVVRNQFVKKVLFFHNSYRMLDRLEVSAEGSVAGKPKPGFWSTDGACQVQGLNFRKDRVTFQCLKLWANVQDDGQLHYFPASAALKGKTDYPEKMEVVFRTKPEAESVTALTERVARVFLSEQDPKMAAAPARIVAYIQKQTVEPDFDMATAAGFAGTPPKAISTPVPDLSREAMLVGQAGKESFVMLVDEQGRASVVGFTHLLQYGLEETTMEAVKGWKFQPAIKDGNPVVVRVATSIEYKRPNPK